MTIACAVQTSRQLRVKFISQNGDGFYATTIPHASLVRRITTGEPFDSHTVPPVLTLPANLAVDARDCLATAQIRASQACKHRTANTATECSGVTLRRRCADEHAAKA